MLDKFCHARYNDKAFKNQYGRLAQLVAHPLDVREVTSSSLVSSTKKPTVLLSCRLSFFLKAEGLEACDQIRA